MSEAAGTRPAARSPSRAVLERGGFALEVTAGPDAGAVFTPSAERSRLGTHRSCELVLTDPTVSRFHCELVSDDRGLRIRDLGSRNGTLVEGVSVVEAHLGPRTTRLQLGDTLLALRPAGAPLRIALAAEDRFGRMVGASAAMRAVFATLTTAAASDATVLLEGETGVGKDLAAEAIHAASSRRDGPLVVVDCGAVPSQLLESELFGHVRGAFTGAHGDRAGAFEQAQGGTLFLDEIGELGLDLQPKLLRALESRTIKRVGATAAIPLDLRVIAATNRSLLQEVNAKRFRSDLYYRLAVLVVRIPPLRERLEDLPQLVEEILAVLGLADHPAAAALRRPESLARLESHPWPGNVRELRNHVERFVAFGSATPDAIQGETPPDPDPTIPYRVARQRWLDHFQRIYMKRLLELHDDNVTAAAAAAGINRVHLHRLLVRAGLR